MMLRMVWLLLLGVWAGPAQAHLMVAQKGTLNLQGDGAFLVLSLPVSAFAGTSQEEVVQQVQQGVVLRDAQGARPLQGVLVSPSPDDDTPGSPVHQLVILGRYGLAQPAPQGVESLQLTLSLYGTGKDEQRTELTVINGEQRSLLMLDAQHATQRLFASRWQVFVDAIGLGVSHILSGPDHLLFLAVVLFGTVGWRQVLAVLTTFTVGHAITLSIGSLGWLVLPDVLVESAIALTIAVMAAVEWWMRRRERVLPLKLRLLLVLGCALIHGLGFAAAVRELGLTGQRLLPTIAGFNVGIEAGQVLVALPLMAALWAWRRRATG
jgi:hypothetical protein